MSSHEGAMERHQARVDALRRVLEDHDVEESMIEPTAQRLAIMQRQNLASGVPGASRDMLQDLQDAHDEAGRREGFLMSAIKFPFRHPFVTGAAVLGGVAAVGYGTGRLAGWIENILQRVGLRSVSASIRSINPLGGTEGINPGGTVPGGLNQPL